jgi:phosphoenolpyruvate---glycerone phosphotransferase subunit DhaL
MLMRTYLTAVRRAHAELTRLDQITGDGDFGDNLVAGLELVVARLPAAADPHTEFATAADCFLDHVGGTSGPLLGLLFQAIANRVAAGQPLHPGLVAGLTDGIAAIARAGGARAGDRTLLDCLIPVRDALAAAPIPVDWSAIARAALRHASDTAALRPRAGRASYLADRAVGTPDPGATGMALLFSALAAEQHPERRDELPGPARP